MIAKLMGLVDSVFEGFVILNVGGVGYRVFVSTKTLSKLPAAGEATSLFIETQVREDHIHLFGFADLAEQTLFNTLTIVQGVGAKVAMAILSVLSVKEIQMAVMTGDAKAFTRVSGIGPKLATRLITELKGKTNIVSAEDMPVIGSATVQTDSKILSDAVSALCNLGYSRTEAGIQAAQIFKNNPDANLSEVIRLTLKEMGKGTG